MTTQPSSLSCPVCHKQFQPTAGQLKLRRDGQEIYCSAHCAISVRGQAKVVQCHYCQLVSVRLQSEALADPMGKHRFCCMSCLYAYLMENGQALSVPPVSVIPRVTLAQVAPIHRGSSGKQYPETQLKLYVELVRRWPQLEWELELFMATGRYHNGVERKYRIDIASRKYQIAVECDGSEHATYTGQISDRVRDAVLAELGWATVRLTNKRIRDDMVGCCQQVQELLIATGVEKQINEERKKEIAHLTRN